MPDVLVLFAHPAFEKSRVQRVLRAAVEDLPSVTFHDLYESYPDFQIDVRREQDLLEAHRHVIMQFPFYWYGTPSLLKEWQDLVLEHGWAYGKTGRRLEGKTLGTCVSTGGPLEAYAPDGGNRFTMRQLLAPLDCTAKLCRMRFLAPFTVHRSLVLSEGSESLLSHGAAYREFLVALAEGRVDLDLASKAERISDLTIAPPA